jgi:hypothetical protein
MRDDIEHRNSPVEDANQVLLEGGEGTQRRPIVLTGTRVHALDKAGLRSCDRGDGKRGEHSKFRMSGGKFFVKFWGVEGLDVLKDLPG